MSVQDDEASRRLEAILEKSRALGFLGPGPVRTHIDHAMSFFPWIQDRHRIMDLGSGGGVPGLVLASRLISDSDGADRRLTLVDANRRRCGFLIDALSELGLSGWVDVVQGRAEVLAHTPGMRHAFDCVIARSFGPPAVVAECAVGFLVLGGRLVVSEPPDAEEGRWTDEGLSVLGLTPVPMEHETDFTMKALETTTVCDDQFPRRNGVPAKRPLF